MQPPSILLEGPPGSGKSFSIPTFIRAGVETFVLGTEPDFVSSLLEGAKHHGVDVSKLHWTTVTPTPGGWSALDDMVRNVSLMSYEDITKIKQGIGKDATRKPFVHLLDTLKDFKCERDGKSYGDYTSWGSDRALVLDSLTGFSMMAMALTIGFKPAAHQGEWGVAMNVIEQILLKLTSDRKCFLCVTAHVEKETNELTGVQQIMTSTLGRKLAPKIPRFFSEVVLSKRTPDGYFWSTLEANTDLKNRALPAGDKLPPSFFPVVEAFRAREKLAAGTQHPASSNPVAA